MAATATFAVTASATTTSSLGITRAVVWVVIVGHKIAVAISILFHVFILCQTLSPQKMLKSDPRTDERAHPLSRFVVNKQGQRTKVACPRPIQILRSQP